MSEAKEINSAKFIQISTCCSEDGDIYIHALTEDGVVYYYDHLDKVWRRKTQTRIG